MRRLRKEGRDESGISQFKFVDLFAGIGGFHRALRDLGGHCVLACEIDPTCRKFYQHQFPETDEIVENIREITRVDLADPASTRSTAEIRKAVPDHDVLCAGFPCQPFSKSGAQLGVRDETRGTLFFDIMEIVRAREPRYLILENVRNLAGPRHRDTWLTIRRQIRDAGYSTLDEPLVLSPHLLPADNGGCPQVRERVFILAIRQDGAAEVARDVDRLETIKEVADGLRRKSAHDPSSWDISRFLDPDRNIRNVKAYRLSDKGLTWIAAWDWFVRNLPDDDLPGFPIWSWEFKPKPRIPDGTPEWKAAFLRKNSDFYRRHRDFIDMWRGKRWGPEGESSDGDRVGDFPMSRQSFEWQARRVHPTSKNRTLRNLVLQFRPSGIRVKPATYLPALVAITQTSIVGPDVRRGIKAYRTITPREAAKLQGMPDDIFESARIEDRDAYRQLGNAVNVGVVRFLASQLLAQNDVRRKGNLELPFTFVASVGSSS